MYLDAVKEREFVSDIENIRLENPRMLIERTNGKTEVFEKWNDWQASEISHHGEFCCEIAREWITATDFSELGNASLCTGPRWLRQKFNWGASAFPIFWCEAVRRKTLDCGALAALAHEVFTARGVRSFRVQMVQRFSRISTAQWTKSWSENGGAAVLPWTNEDLIYHEGCAISTVPGGEIKIWDASAGWWIDPNSKDGYGSLLAVRLSAFDLSPEKVFIWGDHKIPTYQWTQIN